jgi:hypothetical protein
MKRKKPTGGPDLVGFFEEERASFSLSLISNLHARKIAFCIHLEILNNIAGWLKMIRGWLSQMTPKRAKIRHPGGCHRDDFDLLSNVHLRKPETVPQRSSRVPTHESDHPAG